MPPLDTEIADLAPDEPTLTPYDRQHAVTYVRLLDAEKDNADWREVARIVLHIDPAVEPARARREQVANHQRVDGGPCHAARARTPGHLQAANGSDESTVV